MDYPIKSFLHDFIRMIKPYKAPFLWGTFIRVIGAVMGLYPAYALSLTVIFITKYNKGDDLLPLYIIFSTWVISFIIRYIIYYYSKILCINAGYKAAFDVEKKALNHMSLVDISWHEKENTGNKVKKIQRGTEGIVTIYRLWVVNIVDIVVNFIGVFYIVSRFDKLLSLYIVIYLVIYFSLSTFFRKQTVKASKEKNIKEEEFSGFIFEVMNNIRSVKVLGMSTPLLGHIQKLNNELILLFKKNLFWYHSNILSRSLWQGIGRIILLAFVIKGIFNGQYELGFFILFYGYFSTISTSIEDLSSSTQEISLAKANAGRLMDLFKEKINIDSTSGKVDFPSDWNSIRIINLSFSYGDNKVLDDISLEIKKGEKIGIVGLSGAGKSTLFKLLLKEYEDPNNTIHIGDTPLNEIKRTSYTQHVATVLQDTEVFNLSLKENIVISNHNERANDGSFNKAITISHVDDFVHKLPIGVDTIIGEKGVKLSGGEKQRLGIARAVFKNPEILFLDEATSHLDVESEQKIQDSLKHFFKDVTAIVIAHRLSTVKEMDRIIVLENGKILETGSFDELYASDGRFKEFWDKQKL